MKKMQFNSNSLGYSVTIKHYYVLSHINDMNRLFREFDPILLWVKNNSIGKFGVFFSDNVLSLDYSEPFVQCVIDFEKENDLIHFKLRWL